MASATTRVPLIALVGNPNTGKSTLFNRLTGVRQRVGNYPGVTVERKSGRFRSGDWEAELIDLPGTYSLAAASLDERVVVDVLGGHLPGTTRPDAVLCVVDATNLSRNLFLASQVADLGLPMVIALNCVDAAEQQGIRVDAEGLAARLGVPVVPTVATRGEGVPALATAMARAVSENLRMRTTQWPEPVSDAVRELADACRAATGTALPEAELRRVLFDAGSAIPERIGWDGAEPTVATIREKLRAAHIHPFAIETLQRYGELDRLLEGLVARPEHAVGTRSESIDALLTHRVWGLLLFAALMYLVFQSVYTWAAPFMDLIESAKEQVKAAIEPWFAGMPAVRSLVSDGILEGVGSVVVFVPQIAILFAFIALLEDTGYMARAAFLMDRLLAWCGLNGKSFVPLLSSYACAVPGVLATRTIEDPKARLLTILIAPLMSCSARLPVYVLMIGAFVEPRHGPWIAGAVLFAMHFVGLAVAVPVAWSLNRFVFRMPAQPFLLEMPPYRVPRLRDVLWRIWERVREFLVRAGTAIFAITILLWALLYFPRPAAVAEAVRTQFVAEAEAAQDSGTLRAALADPESDLSRDLAHRIDGAYVEQSLLGRAGRAIQPVFAPAGFDWRITVGVLSSFPAREVIIATLGVIYNLGGDLDEESGTLRETLAAQTWPEGPRAGTPVYTVPVALAVMVFFALCLQCGATVAVIAKESNWLWATFAFAYVTGLAWIGAVLTYQVGTRWFGS